MGRTRSTGGSGRNRIVFDVDFQANVASLKDIQKNLDDVVNKMNAASQRKPGSIGEPLTKELKKAGEMAQTVGSMLDKSLNRDLGTVNLTKFNSLLKQSGLSAQQIKTQLEGAGNAGATAWNKLSTGILTSNTQIKEGNKLLNNMATTMTNAFKWGLASSVMNTVTDSIRKAYDYAVKLDTSLNSIRIVTGDSAEQMANFAEQANNSAKALGTSTLDYTKTALEYYQQGLGDEAVANRTEATLKAANITGTQASQTAEYLTSVWNGFKAEIGSETEYVDKLAAVADSSASNLAELATAMSKTASVANNVGVNFDQLNSQISTVIAVTRQAPETVGNAMKTIYARINDIKTGADGAEVSLGNYTKIMAELGFNVLDADGKLKDTGETIQEVGDRWNTLSREQQTYLTQTMAGKRQMNILTSLFENWDMYSSMMQTSMEAQGTLELKNQRYLESTQAHLKSLKATWEDLYGTLIKTDEVNTGVDLLRNGVQAVQNFAESFGGGTKSLLAFGSIFSYVFREQIGKAIGERQVQMQTFQKELSNWQGKMDFIKAGISNVNNKATAEQSGALAGAEIGRKNAERLSRAAPGLSAQEQEKAIGLTRQIADLKEKEVIAEEKINKILNSNTRLKGMEVTEHKGYLQILTDELNIDEYQIKAKEKQLQELYKKEQLGKELTREEEIRLTFLREEVDLIHAATEADELRKAQNSAKSQRNYQQGELDESINKGNQISQMQAKTTVLTGSLMSIATLWGTIGSLAQTFSDENATAMDKLTQSVMSLGFALPMLITGYKEISTAMATLAVAQGAANAGFIANTKVVLANAAAKVGEILSTEISIPIFWHQTEAIAASAEAEALATTTAGALSVGETTLATSAEAAALSLQSVTIALGPLLLIGAAVIGLIYEMAESYDYQSDKAKEATQKAIDSAEAAKGVKDAYDELKNSLTDIQSAEAALNTLTKGTQEWKEAVAELNNQILVLLQKYPELGKYVINEDGHLAISEEGYDKMIENQMQKVQNSQAIATADNNKAIIEQQRADAELLGRGADKTIDLDKVLEAANLMKDSAENFTGSEEERQQYLKDELDISKDQAKYLLENTDALLKLAGANDNVTKSNEALIGTMTAENVAYQNSENKDAVDNILKGRLADVDSEINKRADMYATGVGDRDKKMSTDELEKTYTELTGITKGVEDMTRKELAEKIAAAEIQKEISNSIDGTVSMMEEISSRATGTAGDIKEGGKHIAEALGTFGGGQEGSLAKLTQKEKNHLIEALKDGDSEFSGIIDDYAKKLGYDSPKQLKKALEAASDDYDKTMKSIGDRFKDSGLSLKSAYNSAMQGWADKSSKVRRPPDYSLDDYQRTGDMLKKVYENATMDWGGNVEALSDIGKILGQLDPSQLKELEGINWNEITVDQLNDEFNRLGVETKASDDTLQQFIDSMKEVNKVSIEQAKQDYKNVHEITNNLQPGATLEKEDIDALEKAGIDTSKFFTELLDGTYKLTVGAEKFKQAADAVTIAPFAQKIEELQEKNDKIQKYMERNSELTEVGGFKDRGSKGDSDKVERNTLMAQAQAVDTFFEDQKTIENKTKIRDIMSDIAVNGKLQKTNADLLARAYGEVKDKAADVDGELKKNLEEQEKIAEQIKLSEPVDSDVDAGELDAMRERLQENTEAFEKDGEKISETIKTSEADAQELAESFLRFNNSIKDVTENYENWNNVLANGTEQEKTQAFEQMRDAYGDMLNMDGSSLSEDFLNDTHNLELMKEAANGNVDAYNDLAEAAAQDIAVKANIDTSQFDEAKADLEKALGQNWDDIEIGAKLNNQDFLNHLSEMVSASSATAKEAQDYLKAMGVDAVVTEKTKDVTEEEENVGWDANITEGEKYSATVPKIYGAGQGVNVDNVEVEWAAPDLTYNPKKKTVKKKKKVKAHGLKVISASKSAGGNIKMQNAGGGVSGSGGSGGGGGGGGKGGGGKKGSAKKFKKPKKQTFKRDPYRDVNIQLKDTERHMSRLEKINKKLTGDLYLKNLKAQNKELQRQLKLEQKKQKIAKKEIERKAKKLNAEFGIKFDAEGDMTNFDRVLTILQKRLDKAWKKVNKYKDDSKSTKTKEKAKANYEAIAKQIKRLQDLAKDYESDVEIFKESLSKQLEIVDKQIENRIEGYNYKINLELDTADFEKKWHEFKTKVLKRVKDDDYANLNASLIADAKTTEEVYDDLINKIKKLNNMMPKVQNAAKARQRMEDLGSDVSAHAKRYKKLKDKKHRTKEEQKEYNKLKKEREAYEKAIKDFNKAVNTTPYGDNVSKLKEDLKKYEEELAEAGITIADVYEEVHENFLNAIDAAKKAFDENIEGYERVNNLFAHNLELSKMLRGDNGAKEQAKILTQEISLNKQKTFDLIKQRDYWKRMMSSAKEGSDEWKKYKENWEAAVDASNQSIQETVQMYQERMEAIINDISKQMRDKLLGGDAYSNTNAWERMIEDSKRYLDSMDRGLNMLSLYNSGQTAMAGKTVKQQQEIQKLIDAQTENLQNQSEVRQIDFEIAQAELDVLLKKQALEDAQNNKTKMRLRRDSQGNYRYQFVRDEDQIDKAQQEYFDAIAQLRQKEMEDYKDTTSKYIEAQQEYTDKLNEIAEEYKGNNEKIRQESNKYLEAWKKENWKIINDYQEMSDKVVQINGVTFNALQENMGTEGLQTALNLPNAIMDTLTALYQPGGEAVSLIDGFATNIFPEIMSQIPEETKEILEEATGMIPQAFGDILINRNFESVIRAGTEEIINTIEETDAAVTNFGVQVGQNFEDLATNLKETVTASVNLIQNQEELTRIYDQQITLTQQQAEAMKDMLDLIGAEYNNTNTSQAFSNIIESGGITPVKIEWEGLGNKTADSLDQVIKGKVGNTVDNFSGNTTITAPVDGSALVREANRVSAEVQEKSEKILIETVNAINALYSEGMNKEKGDVITLNAEFPNANSSVEIEKALNDFIAQAYQSINGNRRTY